MVYISERKKEIFDGDISKIRKDRVQTPYKIEKQVTRIKIYESKGDVVYISGTPRLGKTGEGKTLDEISREIEEHVTPNIPWSRIGGLNVYNGKVEWETKE